MMSWKQSEGKGHTNRLIAVTSRRGFTMLEMTIVLGIVALVLGAIWMAASKVYERHLVAQAADEIWQISNNIRSIYSGQASAVVPDQKALVCSGVFPADMLVGSTNYDCGGGVNRKSPLNPWGGDVSVWINFASPKRFGIVFNFPGVAAGNISKCVDLIVLVPPRRVGDASNLRGENGGPVDVNVGWTSMFGKTPAQMASSISAGGGLTLCITAPPFTCSHSPGGASSVQFTFSFLE